MMSRYFSLILLVTGVFSRLAVNPKKLTGPIDLAFDAGAGLSFDGTLKSVAGAYFELAIALSTYTVHGSVTAR